LPKSNNLQKEFRNYSSSWNL